MEGNLLIAKFMGEYSEGEYFRISHNSEDVHVSDLQYHSSWDWLMPVVETIDGFYVGTHGCFLTFDIEFTKHQATVGEGDRIWYSMKSDKTIDAVYAVVLWFVKWYNKRVEEKKR